MKASWMALWVLALVCLPQVVLVAAGRQSPGTAQRPESVDNQLLLVQDNTALHDGLSRSVGAATGNVDVGGEKSAGRAFGLFQAWGAKHHRVWKSLSEMEQRFRIFADNLRYIETRSSQLQGYRLGLNRFADLTHDEFKKAYLGGSHVNYQADCTAAASPTSASCRRRRSTAPDRPFLYANVSDIPKSVDWREKGALVPIKDQGECAGSSWAFSSVAAVEAVNQIATGELVSLSEQELLDCDRKHNEGCDGGRMDYAFEFIVENGGLDSEQDYPYTGRDSACDIKKRNSHVASIDYYEDVPWSDENALMKAVATQPVSVVIDAGGRDLQLYDGGVFGGPCGKELNHAVVVVGYGTEADGTDYWIVRNSWGGEWGDDGYIKMERVGSADGDGLCGINMEPSYPTKKRPSPAPPPDEVVCDDEESSSCPAGSTCCCELDFAGYCILWGCCPAASATCCDGRDNRYCCPPEFPTCDLSSSSCLSATLAVNGLLDVTERVVGLQRFTVRNTSTLQVRVSSH